MTQDNDQTTLSSALPNTKRAAIYARVATGAQTQTTQPQTAKLIKLANEQGFPTEQITVYEDVGVSGKLALVQRGALSDLLTAIMREDQDPIRTMFVFSEDRLFRDPIVVDIAYFIKVCKERGVTLITPTFEYDFTNAAHVALFRFRCEQATAFRERQARQLTERTRHGRRSSKRAGE